MNFKKLLDGVEYSGDASEIAVSEISGICSDSRKVCPGDVFVCIKGRENNGADYIKEAEKRGLERMERME